MIRRMTEYYVTCDMKEHCVDGFGNSTAFGSPTAKDCEESAKAHGWRRVSKRLWPCPQCAKKADEQADESQAGGGSEG